ncbi:pancreatic adenocarcinoma up-regulated factor [Alexandromys fortis]|uniref:pancreatic adenocarcinoma up-regulated factor n=1 Tax=Alexandromys fortis TaxID=100897 RepID=UPI0021533536|nr:zymogen granule protein 16 homolog B [Microtus fortis]
MFQPEAMLLLVILAMLGTPAFSANDYYGTTTGTPFCTSIPEGKNLTGVRMYVRNNVIMGVQAEHDHTWGDVSGYAEGTPVVLTLSEDEHVLWVFGTYRTYIQQIVLYTSRPRDQYFGSLKGPNEFSDYPQNADHVLKGFCGFYVRGGLRAIKFVWGSASGTCSE